MNKTLLIFTHIGAVAVGAGVTYAIMKKAYDKKFEEQQEEFLDYLDEREKDIYKEATERMEQEIAALGYSEKHEEPESYVEGVKILTPPTTKEGDYYDELIKKYKSPEDYSVTKNVFDTSKREVEEEIDEARQRRFEEGKNHILDDEEDYWDHHNPEREQILGSEDHIRKTHVMSYSEFMSDRGTPIREMTYYCNDDVLLDDTTDEFSNKLFDTTVGWDWIDEYDPEQRFVYLLDGPNNIIYQIDYINGSYSDNLFDGHRDYST